MPPSRVEGMDVGIESLSSRYAILTIHYVYLSDASLLLQIQTDAQVCRASRRPEEASCYLINLRAALIPMQTFPCDIQGTGFFLLFFGFWFFL